MIYTAPGESFETVAQGFQTGLAGTIGVRVVDNVGGESIARTVSGVSELVALSGIYAVTLTAPSTAGEYTVIWDDGSIDEGSVATEGLVVTSSLAIPVGSTGTGMTLGDILDAVLLDRFETSHRPRALQAVNIRYAHLWVLENWTFKYATVNPTIASGDDTLNDLPTDFGVPVYLWDEDGYLLPYLNTDVFYSRYLPDPETGYPEAWTVTNQSLILGPTPDHAADYTLHYERRVSELSDETLVPDWPVAFRMAVVHGAGADLRAAYDDPTAATWEGLLQRDLEALRRAYLIDAVGQPDTWPDDSWAVA